MRGERHVCWIALAAAGMAALPAAAGAGDTYWRHDPATTGDWFDDANWTGGTPGSSDSAYINNDGTAEIASGFAKIDLLYLGDTGGTGGTVALGGAGKLGASHEYIGHAGEGEIDQSGGTHGVGGVLYLGHDATGHGTYILSSGDLDADTLFVGHEGTGVFDQSGGSVAVTSVLELALGSGSIGSYSLSGGEVSAAFEYLAQEGTAWFTHTHGDNTVWSDLTIGLLSGSEGTYTLSGGTLDVRDGIVQVGQAGTGTFNLNGGLVIADELDLGAGGTFSTAGDTGTLRVNTLTGFAASPNLAGSLQFGHAGGAGSGGYSIASAGGLSVGKDLVVGYDAAATLTHAGTWNSVKILQGSLYLGHEATGDGTYDLSASTGSVEADYEFIGHYGTGAFNQSDGANVVEYTLFIGNQAEAEGTYTLSGGALQTHRALIGHYGTGHFVQSNGDYANTDYVVLGRWPGGHGTCELSGGSFSTTTLHVGYEGTGEFNWTAGTFTAVLVNVAAGGTMTVGLDWIFDAALTVDGGTVDVPAHGLTLDAGGAGAMMALNGGSVSIHHVTVGAGQTGSIAHSDGTNAIAGELILGREPGGSGSYVISGGSLSAGDLIVGNDGDGGFGIADAAAGVTVSNRLYFGEHSTFNAVAGATIHMTGSDLENDSHAPTDLPGLGNLTLIFEGGTGQIDDVEVAGEDLRLHPDGWVDNFVLGTLQLGGAAAGRIRLVNHSLNHKPACTEAMYVDNIVINRGAVIDLNGLKLYFLHQGQPRQFFHGDATLDGCVDGADYTSWADHYALTYMSWGEGDFTGDECVDGADYTCWADNYGSGCGATVPEPCGVALLGLGFSMMGRRRRRGRTA